MAHIGNELTLSLVRRLRFFLGLDQLPLHFLSSNRRPQGISERLKDGKFRFGPLPLSLTIIEADESPPTVSDKYRYGSHRPDIPFLQQLHQPLVFHLIDVPAIDLPPAQHPQAKGIQTEWYPLHIGTVIFRLIRSALPAYQLIVVRDTGLIFYIVIYIHPVQLDPVAQQGNDFSQRIFQFAVADQLMRRHRDRL